MPTHKLFLLHSHTPNDRAVLVAAPDMNHAWDRINVSPTGMESPFWEIFEIQADAAQQLIAGEVGHVDAALVYQGGFMSGR
jgi:hypothetical protein